MARLPDARLTTREARRKLPAGLTWKEIHRGLAIGYYRGPQGGSWWLRRRIDRNGKMVYQKARLGVADDLVAADGKTVLSFAQAQQLIFEMAGQTVPAVSNYTVAQAAQDYLDWFAVHSKSLAATKAVINAHILPAFANRAASSLTSAEITRWHHRLVTARALPANDPDAPRRYRSTANRCLTVLKAMLNRAWKEGRIKDNSAWRRVEPFRGVDGSRKVFLTEAQCARLINACQGDFRHLVQAALYTGARIGELAILRNKDFDPVAGALHLQDGKTGQRVIFLTDEGVQFFSRLTAGGRADDLILTHGGRPWGKNHHTRLMARAVGLAGLPRDTTFYALRHTFISWAAKNGMPLQVLAENTGTSVRMIERHYGKYLNSDRRAMLNRALPSLGFAADNVRRLRP